MSEISKVAYQVMWNRLISVVEEQAQALIRTSFSTSVREAGDLSAGVYNEKGEMLAQAVTGTPGHVNAMADAVAHFIRRIGRENIAEDDVYITNNPWEGTGHLHDITVVSPSFHKGRHVGFFACTAHIVDIGGRLDEGELDAVGVLRDEIEILDVLLGQSGDREFGVGEIDALLFLQFVAILIRRAARLDDDAPGRHRDDAGRQLAVVDEDALADLAGRERLRQRAFDSHQIGGRLVEPARGTQLLCALATRVQWRRHAAHPCLSGNGRGSGRHATRRPQRASCPMAAGAVARSSGAHYTTARHESSRGDWSVARP